MKKIISSLLIVTLIITLCAGLCACTQTKQDSDKKVTTAQEEKRINIADLQWEIASGIIKEKRFALMSLTNASEYTITAFSLSMTLKADSTPEQTDAFFASIEKLDILEKNEFEKIKENEPQIHFKSDKVVKSGDTCKNIHCYYFTGTYYVRDAAVCEMFEPDIATVSYIKDGNIVTTNYDFKEKSYSDDSGSVKAFEWSESALAKAVPKPTAEYVELVTENDTALHFTMHGTAKTDFQTYVNACKEQGFTKDDKNYDYTEYSMYNAENETGYKVSINFDPDDEEISVSVYSPEH